MADANLLAKKGPQPKDSFDENDPTSGAQAGAESGQPDAPTQADSEKTGCMAMLRKHCGCLFGTRTTSHGARDGAYDYTDIGPENEQQKQQGSSIT